MMATTSLPSLAYSPMEELVNQSYYPCHQDPRITTNFSQYEYTYRIKTWVPFTWREVLKVLAYLVVFLVSLIGNLLVILVVCYNRHMRTSTNQYLVNLAAADLLVTLVCMWVHIVRHLSHPHYVLPALVCKLDGFVQTTTLLASVLTLTVISVGRFVAVMFPLHARTSPDRANRVIATVWVASAVLACPTLFYRELYSIEWANFTTWQCDEFFPTEKEFVEGVGCVVTYDAKQLFYTILNIALYFLPVAIMIINYSLVVWTLWGAKQPGEHHSVATRNMATRAKKRVVKMVTVVLVVFVICWTPLQTLILYTSFSQEDNLQEWFSTLEFAAYFVAYSNSALNPIIYCGFNASFRQGLVALLTCRHATTGRIYHRRQRLGLTGGTRDTTVGPEPAVLLELSSLRRNRVNHRCSLTPSHSGRLVVTGSNRDQRHNDLCDPGHDNGCKVCDSIAASPLHPGPALHHHHLLNKSDFSLGGQNGGKLSTQASSSSGDSVGRDGVCGCCRRHGRKRSRLPLYNENDIYNVNHLPEGLSAKDAKEDIV
ncbi:QRFP-like peptide receptor isoform X1 [Eriocheir sinensis]|uniref:QRFP-like peptide receptor isoform X1 n=2 Tax=Eriocheir sinensis TaxID=95602 RepID=UPI0021C65873|nr:QRFP-like peptide receptor isoform X1 [Eriocheir sinensis]XP_050718124.1 QRFP-like peptide receptor isoform X1 [Eriocheir sinensis]XP_050718125.1 QRFP-like peptide receptor isoform X1 [Eriocheir sinensis]XP_050718126.1 QRFP-like peptide receptor isoform X1 [Eriocheir sinensis]